MIRVGDRVKWSYFTPVYGTEKVYKGVVVKITGPWLHIQIFNDGFDTKHVDNVEVVNDE